MIKNYKFFLINSFWIFLVFQLASFSSLKILQPNTRYADLVSLFFIIVGVRYFLVVVFDFFKWFDEKGNQGNK